MAQPGTDPPEQRWQHLLRVVALAVLSTAAFWLLSRTALADDFARDPFNLNDGLRTDGVAPIIAGVVTTVVTVLVNGMQVLRTVTQSTNPDAKPGDPGILTQYLVIINTVDKLGARSVRLSWEDCPFLYVYAHCEQVGKGRFPSGDATIQFAAAFDPTWATLVDMGYGARGRCARVQLVEPAPKGTPPTSLQVMVSAGFAIPSVPVTLLVDPPAEYDIEFF